MSIKIALAGNPNSGKTTMFNDLTGSSQRVGNWPGVTVEKKEGKLKGRPDVIIQDLPGIYSLSPYTLEEVLSRNYLVQERPDAIVNIVDGTNIERNLYLTTQLTELGIPVVIALNMIDIVRKNGDTIDLKKLGAALGCEVVETSALKGIGSKEAAQKAADLAVNKGKIVPPACFSDGVEKAIADIQGVIEGKVDKVAARWYAIKLFEGDEKIVEQLKLSTETMGQIRKISEACEADLDDDAESIITNQRYEYIGKVMASSVKKKARKSNLTMSDKIDRIVTNRILALPIFVLVMFVVYYISVTTVGTMGTDWANDGLFGDGFHLVGIGDVAFEDAMGDFELEQGKIEAYLEAAEDAGMDVDEVSEALAFDAEEYEDEAEAELAQAEADEAIDSFILAASTEGIVADYPVEDDDGNVEETLAVSAADFEAAVGMEEPDPAEFGVWVPGIPVLVEGGLEAAGTPDWLNGLILDGIVGGVGAVLGFVPQMLVLFLLLSILEYCGYMARVAFIMDRIFRRFGLSGKSFIPMLIGSGCSVPGIMASRTIENETDRRMTVITTSFIPCGAKMPIIALLAGAVFGGAWWIAPSAYFIGVAAVVVSGIILKKTKMFAGEVSPFIIELPAYHVPSVSGVVRSTWERGWSFIKRAGTIILLSSIVIWFLSGFGFVDGSFGMVEDMDASILANIGNAVSFIFTPLGFDSWQATVATVMGLVAKEEVVGVIGVLFGIGEGALDMVDEGLFGELTVIAAGFGSALAAYSFMIFNLLCAPCFAAMGAIKREMNSAKWTAFAIGYLCVFAYVVSLIVFQLGSLFTGGGFTILTAIAFILLAGLIYLLVRRNKYSQQPMARQIPKKEGATV